MMCEGEQPYSIKINLYCDPSKGTPSYKIEAKSAMNDKCQMEVDMQTKYGCAAMSFGLMWEFIDIYKYFFGFYFLLTGVYYVLYSIEYYKVTSGICLT